MTIGTLIGKVVHSFKTTNEHEESATISVTFDFSTCTDTDIKNWLVSNRAIIMQRPLRTLTLAELKAVNGTTIDASACGKKVKSKHDQFLAGIAALKACDMEAEANKLMAEYNAKIESAKAALEAPKTEAPKTETESN
jgi:hypothetical protein